MDVIDLPLAQLREAFWNPNQIDETIRERLRRSVERFGFLVPLVVRPLEDGTYEVLSGNQRLGVLRGIGLGKAPCIVVDLDDAHAHLLA
ncbi:MAG: ParB N-terminal domain-containing protein [Chloroflexi bacterium]|nr:ParB N-terminal domain-containing protein [Chloroflexota bacterium]